MNTFQSLEAKLRSNLNHVVCVCYIRDQGIVALLEDVHGGSRPTRSVLARGSHITVTGALTALQATLDGQETHQGDRMESDLDALIAQGWMIEFLYGKEGDLRFEGRLSRRLGASPTIRMHSHIRGVLDAWICCLSKPLNEEYFIEGSRRPVEVFAFPAIDLFGPIVDLRVTT